MRNLLAIPLVLLLLVAGIGLYLHAHSKTLAREDETGIRQTTSDFGQKMKNVSLLLPTAAVEIGHSYADYASPALLLAWQQNPLHAPGRLTSSPWPDHIEITSVTKNADGTYTVSGNIILLTSEELAHGGEAGQIPVTLTFRKINGKWLITGYSEKSGIS